MNNEEKNLLDEIWDAVGLDRPDPEKLQTPAPEPQKPEDAPVAEAPVEELPVEKAPAEEAPAEEKEAPAPQEPEPPQEKKPQSPAPKPAPTLVQEKKKDIRFLIIYTVAFVVVISFLIAGSYMITSRIHNEMAENNADLNFSQSTLKNIQDENAALKSQNAALQKENEALTLSQQENEALLTDVADMIEHGEYLAAAQDAYIRGDRALARSVLATVDREKLPLPAQEYYDTLNKRLNG